MAFQVFLTGFLKKVNSKPVISILYRFSVRRILCLKIDSMLLFLLWHFVFASFRT